LYRSGLEFNKNEKGFILKNKSFFILKSNTPVNLQFGENKGKWDPHDKFLTFLAFLGVNNKQKQHLNTIIV
jgi:hypothetical protein